jgi:hypothetical protein
MMEFNRDQSWWINNLDRFGSNGVYIGSSGMTRHEYNALTELADNGLVDMKSETKYLAHFIANDRTKEIKERLRE